MGSTGGRLAVVRVSLDSQHQTLRNRLGRCDLRAKSKAEPDVCRLPTRLSSGGGSPHIAEPTAGRTVQAAVALSRMNPLVWGPDGDCVPARSELQFVDIEECICPGGEPNSG